MSTLKEAKGRLDKLIKKSRADLYKPIAIAEILYRHRVEKNIQLENKEDYRRKSYEWMQAIIFNLHGKTTSLNSKYWDQLFDNEILPPRILANLGAINESSPGIIETYIYAHVREKFRAIGLIRNELLISKPSEFKLSTFLDRFEKDSKLKRSVDKAYEIVVYALFNAVVLELDAQITLSIDLDRLYVLKDFEDFASLVLGIDSLNLSIVQPARLFRLGTANANDAGLDMWANFGPAVQVKHISMSAEKAGDICNGVHADHVVIVCKKADSSKIMSVIDQIGLGEKLRGVITEVDLNKWYDLCFSPKYCNTMGANVLKSLTCEMDLEFPLSNLDRFSRFMSIRDYDLAQLKPPWILIE